MENSPHVPKNEKSDRPDGVKSIPINTDFVKPEYKNEVPDYRTEHNAISLGADAGESASAKQSEIENTVLNTDQEKDTNDIPEPREEKVEPEMMKVPTKIEPEQETKKTNEQTTDPEEQEVLEEVFVDEEQVDRIITRMRESAANINRNPNQRLEFKIIERGLSGGGPRKFENIKTTGLGIEVNEISLEALDIIKERLKELEREFIGQGLNDIQLYATEKALDEVFKKVVELEDIYSSEDPVTIEGQINVVRALNKSIEVYGNIRNELNLEIDKKENNDDGNHGSEPLVLNHEQRDNKGSQDKPEGIPFTKNPEPLRRLLKVETKTDSKQEIISAKEEAKKENSDFSELEEEIDSEGTNSEVFAKTDEPESPFDDLPNITKKDLTNTKAIEERDEFINDEAEIASAAENLMLKELQNKGMQAEWSEGKYFGVVRALSEMRVDDFLRTKDANDKSRLWFADLQQRAGGFAPRLEPNLVLGEYVPKLYQGIIKSQRHTQLTGNEATRPKLLGI